MNSDPYPCLQPAELWRHFAALNKTPRRSGREDAAREYVRAVAASCGATFLTDAYGNALVRAPGRPAVGAPQTVVAVQVHLDMVCESAPGVEHDFDHDPIVPRRDGDAIYARGTTLGADNGIGVSAALALLTDPNVACGPLELLFTVEEEIGLLGALQFDVSLLQARSLINLDSEDDKALTIGSAGGVEVIIRLCPGRKRLEGSWGSADVTVSGLRGGHSGVQIHERRANAIKLLATVLERLREARVDARVASIEGGSAHNAIPRAALARMCIPGEEMERAAVIAAEAISELSREWRAAEPELSIQFHAVEQSTPAAVDARASETLLTLLGELPHGVLAMSSAFAGVVETSANLALVRDDGVQFEILTSMRSLTEEALADVASRVQALAAPHRASAEVKGGYPTWQPKADSALVAAATAAYERVHGRPPTIEIVHGGLECGVLVSRKPELEAVSFGPLICEAHTPQEHVYASTVTDTWRVLLALIGELSAMRDLENGDLAHYVPR
jgi:dipeptidase D